MAKNQETVFQALRNNLKTIRDNHIDHKKAKAFMLLEFADFAGFNDNSEKNVIAGMAILEEFMEIKIK